MVPIVERNSSFVSKSCYQCIIFKRNVSLSNNIILNSKGVFKFSTKQKYYTLEKRLSLETIFLKFRASLILCLRMHKLNTEYEFRYLIESH